METKTKAKPIDKIIGQNVRNRRKELNISQNELGKHLGITFQQIQKYEKGINRISVSALNEISIALKVEDLNYFLKGSENKISLAKSKDSILLEFLNKNKGLKFALKKIAKEQLKKRTI